ncbi:MAG: phosphoadenosine phosphosulfate reductase family protein [Ignisphaera sp.]|nr:phosphoadenosine phosphosulfate reductase family protein [Ignisphaera sp.]
MSKRVSWPIAKQFYWCPNCNVPLLQPQCPVCGSRAIRLSLSPPGDARLALERDYETIRRAYFFEFHTEKGLKNLIGNSVMLLNKAPYYDEMKEVLVDGVQIGRLYFDPFLKAWRFRLSKVGALRVLEADSDIVEKVVVEKKRYHPMDVFRVDREIEMHKQVLLINNSGEVVGLGYSKGKNRIMVHSWWGEAKPFQGFKRPSNVDDVLKVNAEHLNIIESKAKKFIAITAEKIAKPIIASFSGGKDSLVALHLAISLGFEPVVLFNNTGIEMPETVDTVHKIVEQYNLKFVEASAGDLFWKAVYVFGPPGRDYRWCCKICKLTPLARTVKSMWPSGGLNIVGQRAFESLDRARSPRIWRLRWAPYIVNASPINEWSQFEVWLYIFKHKLYVNPLYFMGYERIGCFMCPASTLAELTLLQQTHPDLWAKWVEVLEYWRRRLDLPEEWITYGLWRWNAPARYKTIMAKRLKIVDRINDWRKIFNGIAQPKIVNISKETDKLTIVLDKNVDIEFIEKQYTIVNPKRVEKTDTGIAIDFGTASVSISGKTITLRFNKDEDIERLIDVLKLMYRWESCVGCKSCEVHCPTSVIKVVNVNGKNRPIVQNPSMCIRCRFCLYNCPIAEVYVEHIIAPLILNDPEAWRRKTREHNIDVLKKIKSFIKSQQLKAMPAQIKQGKERKTSQEPSIADFFNSLA